MTPYDLEETRRIAEKTVAKNQSQMLPQIFKMLSVLLQHEADKEADLCLKRHHSIER